MSEPSPAGCFRGKAMRFFDDLEDDNTREFWVAHVDVFEAEIRHPMAALLADLPAAYQPFRVFRMNRDVRFSHDKSPYKTQHSAIHEAGGTSHYVHLDGGGLLVAAGTYLMSRDQLARYRAAVDAPRTGRGLERLLDRAAEDGLGVDAVATESLKTAPRGYPRDHERVALLRRKGVTAHRRLDGAALGDPEAVRAFVVETFERSEPLLRWLRRHVGPPEADPDR